MTKTTEPTHGSNPFPDLRVPAQITLSKELREIAVDAVVAYATLGRDEGFAELVGISWCHSDVTEEQERAAICALAPLLDDARLVTLMFHIADEYVGRLNDESDEGTVAA